MAKRKWSKGIRARKGGLNGWNVDQSPATRHRELRQEARRVGAGEVSRRLNYLSNVANRVTNSGLEQKARTDQRWVAANLEDEDRRDRRRSKPIRVRGSVRSRRHRRSRPVRRWAGRAGRRIGRTLGTRRTVRG